MIYLVMRESYDYECGWQEPIKAFTKKKDAKLFVLDLETKFNLFKLEMEEITEEQTEEQNSFFTADDPLITQWLPEKQKEYQDVCKKWHQEGLKVCNKYNFLGYNHYDEIEFTISEIELEE